MENVHESNTPYLLMSSKNEERQYVEDSTPLNQYATQAGASRLGDTTQQTKLYLGPKNSVAKCPHCGAQIRTTIKHTTTTRTHMIAALCCWSLCCMCCIPYCMDSTRNTDHYCPNCNNYIGSYEK